MASLEDALERIPQQGEIVGGSYQVIRPTRGDAYDRCTATKLAGGQCSAPATRDGLCIAHDPERAEIQAAGRLKGAEARRIPGIFAQLRQTVEDRADEIIGAYVDALGAERMLIGGGEGEVVATVPDHLVRMKAADAIMDRTHGKPTQRSELTGADGGPVGIVAFLSAAVDDLV